MSASHESPVKNSWHLQTNLLASSSPQTPWLEQLDRQPVRSCPLKPSMLSMSAGLAAASAAIGLFPLEFSWPGEKNKDNAALEFSTLNTPGTSECS